MAVDLVGSRRFLAGRQSDRSNVEVVPNIARAGRNFLKHAPAVSTRRMRWLSACGRRRFDRKKYAAFSTAADKSIWVKLPLHRTMFSLRKIKMEMFSVLAYCIRFGTASKLPPARSPGKRRVARRQREQPEDSCRRPMQLVSAALGNCRQREEAADTPNESPLNCNFGLNPAQGGAGRKRRTPEEMARAKEEPGNTRSRNTRKHNEGVLGWGSYRQDRFLPSRKGRYNERCAISLKIRADLTERRQHRSL